MVFYFRYTIRILLIIMIFLVIFHSHTLNFCKLINMTPEFLSLILDYLSYFKFSTVMHFLQCLSLHPVHKCDSSFGP